ncbi:MAG TPA: hypothetical protein VFC52_03120, partial [Solirubrobacterales bacterium]|nr:hypothetical protein [Solirubrobacterales bacterium]
QVVWVSSNLTGKIGPLRFLGQAKVVDPDGHVLARTGGRAGVAVAEVSPRAAIADSRSHISHLDDRATEAYRTDRPAPSAPHPGVQGPTVAPAPANPVPALSPSPTPALV